MTNTEPSQETEAELPDVYAAFVSGATFGMVLGILTLLVRRLSES